MKKRHENPKGLHQMYVVKKLVERDNVPAGHAPRYREIDVDKGSEYFVLRLDLGGNDLNHIKACRIGIHAYANAIEASIPQLAKDLRERYPLL